MVNRLLRGVTVELFDVDGTGLGLFVDVKSVEIVHRLNWFSTHAIAFDRAVPGLPIVKLYEQPDLIVRVTRNFLDAASYVEYIGFHRTPSDPFQSDDQRLLWSYGRDGLDLVHRREIMYPAAVSGSVDPLTAKRVLKSGPVETVIKEIVEENVGPGATAPPRKVDGVTQGFTVAADGALGPTWSGARAWKNVLEVIQEIADEAGMDYRVNCTNIIGGPTFQFVTGYPQLGTDRSVSVRFSPDLGNMVVPVYTKSRTEESNVVAVLGPGEGSARHVIFREDAAAAAESPWNRIESTIQATGEQKLAGLQKVGDSALEERRARENFTFEVLQTGQFLYGRDYFIGDLVSVSYGSINTIRKVVGATLVFNEEGEDIQIEFADPIN